MKKQFCRWFWALAFLTPFITALGCSGVGGPATSETGSQQLPFAESKPLVVPANAMIYVRLREPITSSTAQPGQSFTAVLDEALMVESQVAVPQGAEIGGKVVIAHDSGRLHTAGYVRITLCSVTLNGKTLAMQTNSAMAGGGHIRNRSLSFMKGGAGASWSSSFQASESSQASRKEEAGFAANVKIGFRLTQPLTVSAGGA
jgi:hypothetical protein